MSRAGTITLLIIMEIALQVVNLTNTADFIESLLISITYLLNNTIAWLLTHIDYDSM